MHLVCLGDSWCWGSDLGRNRTVLRYSRLLSEKLKVESCTNLSKPGISNSYIVFTLLNWLAQKEYLSGKRDTSELFISIGWTSPERFDIYPDSSILRNGESPYWKTVGPWIFNMGGEQYNDNYPIDYQYKDHLNFFYAYCKSEESDYSNWVMQVFTTQTLLENLGIRFLMHQAIYDNKHYNKNHDKIKHKDFNHTKNIWDCVKEKTFLHKNKEHASLYSYLKKYHSDEKVLNEFGDHPVKRGHEIISDLLYNHIKENSL